MIAAEFDIAMPLPKIHWLVSKSGWFVSAARECCAGWIREKTLGEFTNFSRNLSDNANCVKLETKSRENYGLEMNRIARCTIERLRHVDVTTALVLQQKHGVEGR
jgi:hypothetical protein